MCGEDHKNEEGLPAWVQQSHASLFTEDATVHVPAGWRQHVMNCLDMMREMDLGIRISYLVAQGTELNVNTEPRGVEKRLIADFLKYTSHICMKCGAELVRPWEGNTQLGLWKTTQTNSSDMPLCDKCLGLQRPEKKM